VAKRPIIANVIEKVMLDAIAVPKVITSEAQNEMRRLVERSELNVLAAGITGFGPCKC